MEERFGRGREDRDEGFAVSRDPESARLSARFENLNVLRAAALAALLDAHRESTVGVERELEEVGFHPEIAVGERQMEQVDLGELLEEMGVEGAGEERVAFWARLQEEPDPFVGVGFLIGLLESPLERESAAAAAALWRLRGGAETVQNLSISYRAAAREEGVSLAGWDGEAWHFTVRSLMEWRSGRLQRIEVLVFLLELRLLEALRSPDPVVVSLAAAAGLPPALAPEGPSSGERSGGGGPLGPHTVSTMIHGTWGWKGDWWRPGGGFHQFIRGGLRPNLYAEGARFSWSGGYWRRHRQIASIDFCEWAQKLAPHGLQSVFGHSYGGEIAARSLLEGAPIEELVLLSAPCTGEVVAAIETGIRVIDVRLKLDPVLLLARTRQKLPDRPNVKAVKLTRWGLDHSSTHEERVWVEEDIARRVGM